MSYKAQSDSVSSSSNEEVKLHYGNRPQYEQPHLTFDNKVNRLVVPLYCGTCRAYGCKCSNEEPIYSAESFSDGQNVPGYGQQYSFGQSSPLAVPPSNAYFSTGIPTNEFLNNGLDQKSLNKSLSNCTLPSHIPKEPLNNFYLIQQQQQQQQFYHNTPNISNQLNSGLSNYQHTNSAVNLVINPIYQHQQLPPTHKNVHLLNNYYTKTNSNYLRTNQMENYITNNAMKKYNGERYDHNRRSSRELYELDALRTGSGFLKKNREYFILDNYGSNRHLSSQSVSSNSSNVDSNFKPNANIFIGTHKNKYDLTNRKNYHHQGRLSFESYLTFDKKPTNQKSTYPNTSIRNKKFAAYESILYRSSQEDSSTSSSLSTSPTPLLDQFSSCNYDSLNKNSVNLRQMANLNRNKSFHFDSRVPKLKPSQILCRLGNSCRFKRENKCKYYHPTNLRNNNPNRFSKNEILISDYTIDLEEGPIDLEMLASGKNTKNKLTSKKSSKSTNTGSKEDLSLSIYSSTSSLASLKKLNLESFNITSNILNTDEDIDSSHKLQHA